MMVLGVTGGVGTGKSTVAAMFKDLGAVVLDADVIARQVIEPRGPAWRKVVRAFGREILHDDQTINRQALAARVFRDPSRRKQLEAIIHPQVLRSLRGELHRLRWGRRVQVVVLDVPLLFEVGAQRFADAVVVVTARPHAQRARLKRTYRWSDEEIRARVAAQWKMSAKVALADYVVENSKSVRATRQQVRRIWNRVIPHSIRRNSP